MGKPSSSDNEETERKAGYGCELAPKIPEGTVLQDLTKKSWILGKPIGSGAFGDVYLACQGDTFNKDKADYVIKLEPHNNGPLFTELHCLARIGKQEHRLGWKTKADQPGTVLMPVCHGYGSFVYEEAKLRFIVIDKLGTDLERQFESGEKPFPLVTALRIGLQLLDTLEYVHDKGYCHNDIKAQNLLLGPTTSTANNVYLVDFGLACKFMDGYGFHKPHEADERRAHDGTLEYTSRDAHIGAHSRRGDLETMGYNLVHWVSGTLPWLKDMDPQAPEAVEEQKNYYMNNRVGFLAKCFHPDEYPAVLSDFMDYVAELQFDTKPDYAKLKSMLTTVIDSQQGKGGEGKLIWVQPAVKKAKRGKKGEDDENSKSKVDDELSRGVDDLTMDESSNLGEDSNMSIRTRKTRSQVEEGTNDTWNWEEVLKKNPDACRAAANTEEEEESNARAEKQAKHIKKIQMQILENPTLEMCRIMARLKELEDERRAWLQKDQLQEFNKQRKAELQARFAAMDLEPVQNTPAMDEVISRKDKRKSDGRKSPCQEDYDQIVDKDEVATRKKASNYLTKLKELERRPKKKILAKKVSKKLLTKKVMKKVVRPAVKTSEAQLSTAKAVIATRASARVKPTSILEKSKQLIKKAVQKSKEKIKVSPVAVRRLRSRTKPSEDANENETAESPKAPISQDEEAKDTVVEPMEEDNSENLKENKDIFGIATEEKSDKDISKVNEDQEMEDISTETNKENNKVDKIDTPKKDANKKDNQKTPIKTQAAQDTATPEKSLNDDENKSPDIIASKSQPSLEEHIDALAKTKESLFDSLWSEPSKKKEPKKGKTSEESSKDEEQAGVELDPVQLQQFDLPLLDTGEPLTVDTNTGPTTQPMFSPDDDSDNENTSVQGIMNFNTEANSPDFDQNALDHILSVLSPEEEKAPSTGLSFPSFPTTAPSLSLSPAISLGSQSPFLGIGGSNLSKSPLQPALSIAQGQSPNQLLLSPLATSQSLQTSASQSLAISSAQPVSQPVIPPITTSSLLPTSKSAAQFIDQPSISSKASTLQKPQANITSTVVKTNNSNIKTNNVLSTAQSVTEAKGNEILTARTADPVSDKSSEQTDKRINRQSSQLNCSSSPSIVKSSQTPLKTSIKLPQPSKPKLALKIVSPSNTKTLPTKVPESKLLTSKNESVASTVSVLGTSTTITTTTVSTVSLSSPSPGTSKSLAASSPARASTSVTVSNPTRTSLLSTKTPTPTSKPPIPTLKISTPLAKAGSRRAYKHFEDQGFQLEDFEEFTDTKDADFVEPKSASKRGRPKKSGTTSTTPPPPIAGDIQPHKTDKGQCQHFSKPNEEQDGNEPIDNKFLSRSLSSIKQRLKLLGKDMITPKKGKRSKKVDSPFTLKIKKDVQGKWQMDSTPKSERIILKISSAKKKTPTLKIKPIERNCVSEKPIGLKITLKGRAKVAPLEGTPKSRFVPEGWVSFEKVQTEILPKLKEESPSSETEDATADPDKVTPLDAKTEDNTKEDEDKTEKASLSLMNAETNDAKSPTSNAVSVVTTTVNSLCASTDVITTKIPNATIVTTTSASVPTTSPITTTASTVTTQPQTPTIQHKPKISLRTDLFEVKTESSSTNNSSILRSKLNSGRRNLMDSIDNMKDQKSPGFNDNRLVVLNHVTEKLSDPPESWLSYSASLQQQQQQQQQQPEKKPSSVPSGQDEAKSPIVSCYCCPTRECRRKGLTAFPFGDHTSKDPNLMSTLEKSLLSIYADKGGFLNPLAQGNNVFGAGFGEFDPTALASLACLQSSLLGGSSGLLAAAAATSSGSPTLPGLPGKSGLELMLENEMLKQSKEKQINSNQGKVKKNATFHSNNDAPEQKELERQDSLENICSVLQNFAQKKQSSPEKSPGQSSSRSSSKQPSKQQSTQEHVPSVSSLLLSNSSSSERSSPLLLTSSLPNVTPASLLGQFSLASLIAPVSKETYSSSTPESPSKIVTPRSSTSENVVNASTSSSVLAKTSQSQLQHSIEFLQKSTVPKETTKSSNSTPVCLELPLQTNNSQYQGSIFDAVEETPISTIQFKTQEKEKFVETPRSDKQDKSKHTLTIQQLLNEATDANKPKEKVISDQNSSKINMTTTSERETNNQTSNEMLDTLAMLEDLEKSNVLSEMCKVSEETVSNKLPLVDGASEPLNCLESAYNDVDDNLRTPEKAPEDENEIVSQHQTLVNEPSQMSTQLTASTLQPNDFELESLPSEIFAPSDQERQDTIEVEPISTSIKSPLVSESLESTLVPSISVESVIRSSNIIESEPEQSILLNNQIEMHNKSAATKQVDVPSLSDNQSSLNNPDNDKPPEETTIQSLAAEPIPQLDDVNLLSHTGEQIEPGHLMQDIISKETGSRSSQPIENFDQSHNIIDNTLGLSQERVDSSENQSSKLNTGAASNQSENTLLDMAADDNQVLKDFDSFETFAAIQNLLADEDLSSDFVAETLGDTDVINKSVDISVNAQLLNDNELTDLPDVYLQTETKSTHPTNECFPIAAETESSKTSDMIESGTNDQAKASDAPVIEKLTESSYQDAPQFDVGSEPKCAIAQNTLLSVNTVIEPPTQITVQLGINSNIGDSAKDDNPSNLVDSFPAGEAPSENKSQKFSDTETLVDSGLESAEIGSSHEIEPSQSLSNQTSLLSETLSMELSQQPLSESLNQIEKSEVTNVSQSDKLDDNSFEPASISDSGKLFSEMLNQDDNSVLSFNNVTEQRGTKRKSTETMEDQTPSKKFRLDEPKQSEEQLFEDNTVPMPSIETENEISLNKSDSVTASKNLENEPIKDNHETLGDTDIVNTIEKTLSGKDLDFNEEKIISVANDFTRPDESTNSFLGQTRSSEDIFQVDKDVIFNLGSNNDSNTEVSLDDTIELEEQDNEDSIRTILNVSESVENVLSIETNEVVEKLAYIQHDVNNDLVENTELHHTTLEHSNEDKVADETSSLLTVESTNAENIPTSHLGAQNILQSKMETATQEVDKLELDDTIKMDDENPSYEIEDATVQEEMGKVNIDSMTEHHQEESDLTSAHNKQAENVEVYDDKNDDCQEEHEKLDSEKEENILDMKIHEQDDPEKKSIGNIEQPIANIATAKGEVSDYLNIDKDDDKIDESTHKEYLETTTEKGHIEESLRSPEARSEPSFAEVMIAVIKFIPDDEALYHIQDLLPSTPPRRQSDPGKKSSKSSETSPDGSRSPAKLVPDTLDDDEEDVFPDTDEVEEEKVRTVGMMRKLSKPVKNSSSALTKVMKKTIQKKSENSLLQKKLQSLKKDINAAPGKIRRPPREVFLTNADLIDNSPFKKPPTLGGEEKREVHADDGNRQILESITTGVAARRKRRASSSSTVSSTSDSVRSRSRTRHESNSSHASDTSSTRSTRKSSLVSSDVCAATSSKALLKSPENKSTKASATGEKKETLKSAKTEELTSAKGLTKAKKKLFASTKKLLNSKSKNDTIKSEGDETEKKTNLNTSKNNTGSAKKKGIALRKQEPKSAEKKLKKDEEKDITMNKKETSKAAKLKKSVSKIQHLKKGLKRKHSTTSVDVQAKKRRVSVDIKTGSTKTKKDEDIVTKDSGSPASSDSTHGGDDTDTEEQTVVHVQVDDEITLCISDSTYSEYQKIEANGPSPVKKTKLKKKKSSVGLNKVQKSTQDDKEKTAASVKSSKQGTQNLAEKPSKPSEVSSPVLKKKKKKVVESEGDPTNSAAGLKKKKRKILNSVSGVRKGRSGANTRSTNIHL